MGMILNLFRIHQDQLDTFLADSTLLDGLLSNDEIPSNYLDLCKSWDGLIFLLTGGTYSGDHHLNRIFFSCNFIDEEQDLGYGPAHYLSAKEVKEYALELSTIQLSHLEQNYDPIKMDKIDVYPSGIWERDGEAGKEYLIEYFEELNNFYQKAAQKNEAIITFIC